MGLVHPDVIPLTASILGEQEHWNAIYCVDVLAVLYELYYLHKILLYQLYLSSSHINMNGISSRQKCQKWQLVSR